MLGGKNPLQRVNGNAVRTLKNFIIPKVFFANIKSHLKLVTVQQSLMYDTYDGIGIIIRNNLHKQHQIFSEFLFRSNCQIYL